MTAPWMPPLPSAGTLSGEPLAWIADVEQAMRQAQADAARAALERAAKVCEQSDADGEGPDCWDWHSKDYAHAIRALAKEITP